MAPLRALAAQFAAEHVAPEAGDGERLAGRLAGAPPPAHDARPMYFVAQRLGFPTANGREG